MKTDLLAKWMNGELSPAELEEFQKRPEYRTYERIMRASENLSGPDFDVEAALDRVRQARTPAPGGKVVRMRPITRWMGVAAAVVLLFGAAYFYISTRPATFRTGIAQQSEVVLPDASEITLNAGSLLSYSAKGWETERRVNLEGEAFFRVAKGKTFTVATEAGDVTVLGTQFNVLQRDGIFIVRCYEGRVRVTSGSHTTELPAGAAFRMVDGIVEAAGPADGTSAPAWTRNESEFHSLPLSAVLEEFGRQFDVRVTTQGVDLTQRFTGSFSNTNMKLALESISTPLQLATEVNGNQVLLYARETP